MCVLLCSDPVEPVLKDRLWQKYLPTKAYFRTAQARLTLDFDACSDHGSIMKQAVAQKWGARFLKKAARGGRHTLPFHSVIGRGRGINGAV